MSMIKVGSLTVTVEVGVVAVVVVIIKLFARVEQLSEKTILDQHEISSLSSPTSCAQTGNLLLVG